MKKLFGNAILFLTIIGLIITVGNLLTAQEAKKNLIQIKSRSIIKAKAIKYILP